MEKEIKLTESQEKALKILSNTGFGSVMKAAVFAEKMWPDSKMHTKRSNQGNGACIGKAAWLAGGAYLRKLEKLGFVYSHDYGYCITSEGKKALNQSSPQGTK